MVTKVIIFLIIFTSSVFAQCKNYSTISNSEIKDLQIKIIKEKAFLRHVSKFYFPTIKSESLSGLNVEKFSEHISKFYFLAIKSSLKKVNKKKNFKATITINYNNGNYCSYEARLRMHGDRSDHISLINGVPSSSLNVKLKEGNIKNITRFILFKPNSRNYANEIFAANLFSHLGFLSPRTFKVKVKMLNSESEFIFQESLKKELLEYNKRVEAPILESKEDTNFHFKMARVSNKEWIKENKNKYIVSLNGIRDYNFSLLKSYKFNVSGAKDESIRIDEKDFDEDEFKQIIIFDAIMHGIGAGHGLSYDDRRFYYDPVYSKLEPIYYDGDVNILSKINYDRYTGTYKKILYNGKIQKPFLNFYLNSNRQQKTRFRNPTVTNTAKKGANLAILRLKKINSSILLTELHSNGFSKISIDELNFLISQIIERLQLVAEAKVYEGKIDLEKSLYLNYENEMKLDNDLNLVFINNQSSLSNQNEILVEECSYSLNKCETHLIDEKKLMKLIEQKNLHSNKSVFINFDKNEYADATIQKSKNNIKNKFETIKIDEFITISINKNVKVFIDKKNKIMNLDYLNNKGRVVIFDSKINSWLIKMNNLSTENNFEFDNMYNLTGCLTIIDTLLNEADISGKNFNCEDTVNFIRSSGSLNNIDIRNSRSDSLDADFSQLDFNSINIENSKNDCLDVSYGEYKFKNINLKNCGDKAVSVGEKSKASFDNLNVEGSIMGVASKDSSEVYINNANIKDTKICLNAYKKKQEFNGSFLEVNNFNCKIFEKKIMHDNKSILIVKNEL